MPLHTDHRPTKFKQIVGNESTIRAIKSKLKSKNRPRVYLITGPSGTGKTTVGRIIAKNCNVNKINLKELDSADFRGIDSARAIRKNVQFAPMGDGNRAYLLDEVHRLTNDAQEALLKPLEECPEHAIFILCTTNPEKLKVTLKRRCTHFELSSLDEETVIQALNDVVKKEKKKVPGKIIEEIAERSLGSMGIALNYLDMIIDLSMKDMKKQIKNNEKMQNESIDLCRGLMNKAKWVSIAKIIKGLDKAQYESVRRHVLVYSANALLKSDNGRAYLVMDAFINPFYDNPREQLIKAAYECLYAE